MDAERIDDLSPEARIEVMEYYLLADTKRRDFRDSRRTERRAPLRWLQPWPQSQPWTVHGQPAAARAAWTSSYVARQSPQWRVARGFRVIPPTPPGRRRTSESPS